MASTDFLQLFHPHVKDLQQFLLRKMGCAATAADLVQETWLRILTLDPQRTIDNPRSLLFRIAVNVAIDHQRKSSRESRHLREERLGDDVPDRAPSAETVVFNKQQVALLQAAVAELPPKRQAIFLMLKRDHMTYAQVATALGIAESTVVKQMVKALAFCKQRVEQGKGLF